ncbi:HET-domain-containing protein [Lophiostoma macrostomum CBS 122681]|uniref:HET-domain-containing protein n=1 Tax=Lophiostoma macrostomum CBS 122681 TaxID=1314788 RepID=A0A6A6SU21_9PLEO|nr:HET-domain-containing protein [Lophiostoma macrostomum CBS 122681]
MRLLNSRTLDFRTFGENDLPRYVILSHTWGEDEVSYQDMCWVQKLRTVPKRLKEKDQIKRRHGYEKIVRTAEIAHSKGYHGFWADTCCIDKSSSAELQEAINSMFRWYRKSEVCIVYLADAAHSSQDLSSSTENLARNLLTSRWMTRGWTLQELIAPRVVAFYDENELTGIPPSVLQSGDPTRASIAQRMSWAAGRTTTKIEDEAYCLLGIFGIHMPMLYGEGRKAFIRLQEEIMKSNADDSLFAWTSLTLEPSSFCGLLAASPSNFKSSGNISRGRPVRMSTTNIGVQFEHGKRIGLRLQRLYEHDDDDSPDYVQRRKNTELNYHTLDQQYARVGATSLLLQETTPEGEETTVYVRQNPYISTVLLPYLSRTNLLLPISAQTD